MVIVIAVFISLPQMFNYAKAEQSHTVTRPQKTMETLKFANGVIRTKKVVFPNGDVYWMKRIEFANDKKGNYSITIPIKGNNGTFRYVEQKNQNKTWRVAPLVQILPKATGFVDTNQMHMIVSSPGVYKKNGYSTMEEQMNQLPTLIKKNAAGWSLIAQFPQKKNTVAEMWWLESKQLLVDWKSNPNLDKIWLYIDLTYHQKWSWDGFYVRTPTSYTPYSPRMFWRLPANYAANSFIVTGGSRAAEDLGWVMLDTILPNQNADGYWETQPRSEWLWKDYKIGAGFYDTRFNTDIALLLLKGYQKYQDKAFFQSTLKYSNWLLKHIQKEHYVVKGEKEGWLVADYSYKLPHKKTHVALNHQLQEINYLYHMYLETKQNHYKEFADKLLYGIKNTKSRWIKPDRDLHYAYLSNQTMGLPDYPYLTYNDMVETQTLLLKINGYFDEDLAELMISKKEWMDHKGVTGYRTSVFLPF